MSKQTTKLCSLCSNTNLVLLHSIDKKACTNHVPVFYFDWTLDEGQESAYSSARTKRKAETSDE